MKVIRVLLLSCSFLILSVMEGVSQRISYIDEVDPIIGSAHSRWFFFTPAARPFGMAKPSPSTNGQYGNESGWEAVGYDSRHNSIEGFVNYHEFQIGGISIMPTVGNLETVPGKLEDPNKGYRSRFLKDDEVAKPGYYSVKLKDYNIFAELTSTQRVAYHRYTFPESSASHIIFDIGNRQGESGEVTDAYVSKVSDRKIEGFVFTLPEYVKNYQPGALIKMYFVAELDKSPDDYGTFIKDEVKNGNLSAQGKGAGIFLTYETDKDESISIKIGLSYTSIENAKINLKSEASERNFDQVKLEAQKNWNKMLGRIAVEGGTKEDRTKFYTGLYHALLGRGLANDVNGSYMKNNGTIGQIPLNESGVPKYNHYNTDAVWGAFWNLGLLWAMAYPDYLSDFVNTQLDIYEETGWLADGIATSKYVSGVGTNFMGQFISSAFNRGAGNFDKDLAYQAVRKNELGWQNRPLGVGKADTKIFIENSYVPYSSDNDGYASSSALSSKFSASHTLEYSFSAYAAASMAKTLNKHKDHDLFIQLSKGWKKLFDEKSGFVRPRNIQGEFIEDFDPYEPWRGFQEGNAYQYTFYVPHDPNGLIELMGTDTFNERLNSLFEVSKESGFSGGKTVDAFAGVNNVYNHGNQPSLQNSWLFNFSGAPWLTQKWVREISNEFYGTGSLHGYGLGQDEDQGQLGAWYVLAGIGLFDVKGGSDNQPTLQLSLPFFEKITIQLHPDYYTGEEFIIHVDDNSSETSYIHSASLNGENMNSFSFPWEKFIQGGTLELESSATPNKNWGKEYHNN